MAVWRYEISLQVLKNISRVSVQESIAHASQSALINLNFPPTSKHAHKYITFNTRREILHLQAVM